MVSECFLYHKAYFFVYFYFYYYFRGSFEFIKVFCYSRFFYLFQTLLSMNAIKIKGLFKKKILSSPLHIVSPHFEKACIEAMIKVKKEHAIVRASGTDFTSGCILTGLLLKRGSWLLMDSVTSVFFSLQRLHCFLVLEYVLPAIVSW